MAELMTMVKTAKSAIDLFKWLESGDAADVFITIEFEAAKEAFRRISTANDKKSQTRVCIGHLNSVFNGLAYQIENENLIDRTLLSRIEIYLDKKHKACFILCLRCICHSYIGENFHLREDLKLAEKYRDLTDGFSSASAIWFFSGVINPLSALDVLYTAVNSKNLGEYIVDKESIACLKSILLA